MTQFGNYLVELGNPDPVYSDVPSLTDYGTGTQRRELITTPRWNVLNEIREIWNSTDNRHLYLEFFTTNAIQNSILKCLVWGILIFILMPIALLMRILFRKKEWATWLYWKLFYSSAFVLLVLTFVPLLTAVLYEYWWTDLSTDFDIPSLVFSIVIGLILFFMVPLSFYLVWRHNKFWDIPKIWEKFSVFFLYFRTNLFASLYWPCHLTKMGIICIVLIMA